MMIHIIFLKKKIFILQQLVIINFVNMITILTSKVFRNSIQMKDKPMTFISEFSKGDEFSDTSNDPAIYDNKIVYTFKPHNSKYETKILQKYNLSEIIDIKSKTEFPLLKNEQSRNQFFIPLLILISIIILNLIYKALKKTRKNK